MIGTFILNLYLMIPLMVSSNAFFLVWFSLFLYYTGYCMVIRQVPVPLEPLNISILHYHSLIA